MEQTKILITGATGYIGRRLKNRLLAHPDYQLRLFVRNKRKVGERVRQSVEIVEGDKGLRGIHVKRIQDEDETI